MENPDSVGAPNDPGPLSVGLNAVIVAVTEERPRILTVAGGGEDGDPDRRSDRGGEFPSGGAALDTLPFGPLDPAGDRTLELTLRGWVRERTGFDLGYVEQLYTFGDRDRGLQQGDPSRRTLSIAYLALMRETEAESSGAAAWRDVYGYLPWEDWRRGRPAVIPDLIAPHLEDWIQTAPDSRSREERRLRAAIAFGLESADWDGDRVLDRYELLYSVGLVEEAFLDRGLPRPDSSTLTLGRPMALDHRRMLATALGRIRGKTRYRPVVFELMPARFTLLQLQRVVEALAGVQTHKQNFRRLVERGGLVEGTGAVDSQTGGRPAELFRFRKEVLRERRAPGVGLPGT
ncbi:MAG: hypothetical protein EA351_09355 [Gemmatimonadales bacterium]|nr:MAG: hypothetical protein EA351_09355 [Gemmatimonadales bacterium]